MLWLFIFWKNAGISLEIILKADVYMTSAMGKDSAQSLYSHWFLEPLVLTLHLGEDNKRFNMIIIQKLKKHNVIPNIS